MQSLSQPKWLLGASIFLCVAGAFLVYCSGSTERRANALPRMTCDDLIRRGRAAPQFVTLTDVHLGQRGHAFQYDMDAALKMYVPMYSARLQNPPRNIDLALVLEVLDDRDRQRLLRQPKVGELTVQLWRSDGEIDLWAQNKLLRMYPGIRLPNCRILSVGLHEPSIVRAQRERYEGGMMIATGAAFQLGWSIWQRLCDHLAPARQKPAESVQAAAVDCREDVVGGWRDGQL
jgi:hypothetical protein